MREDKEQGSSAQPNRQSEGPSPSDFACDGQELDLLGEKLLRRIEEDIPEDATPEEKGELVAGLVRELIVKEAVAQGANRVLAEGMAKLATSPKTMEGLLSALASVTRKEGG